MSAVMDSDLGALLEVDLDSNLNDGLNEGLNDDQGDSLAGQLATAPLIVGITGINASDNPAPGIGVAKSLKEAGYANLKVVGLAYDAMEPGIYMPWFVDRSYMVPYPKAGSQALIDRLLYIKNSYGLDVVIPNLDSEIPLYIEAAETLANHGIQTYLPDADQFRLRDKQKLAAVAEEAGILAPRQVVLGSEGELSAAIAELGLPLMIKGSLYSAYRADTMQDAYALFSQVVAQWGYPVIAQQVVTGEEMNIIGVGDGDGAAPGMLAIKKLGTTQLGKIWTGITIEHPQMMSVARKIIASTRWRGPFELECIVDGDDVHLIEINPRFPAWVYFATGVGSNLPATAVKGALGKELNTEPFTDTYPTGQLYVRYTDERVCDMSQYQSMVTRGEA